MNFLTKLFHLTFVILIASFVSFGQATKKEGPSFDIADFTRKFEVVQWLVEYDNVAWKTTDFIMAQDKAELSKLGAEWFCFTDKNKVWHAVYGKLMNDGYEPVFHVVMDASAKVTRTSDKIDQEFLDSHARALSGKRETCSFNPRRFSQI